MFKKSLLFSTTLGIAYITLCSYPSKPGTTAAGDCTGSPVATNTCNSCHTASTGGTTTVVGITLIDSATSIPLTSGKYTPGATYIVTLAGANTKPLSSCGFQVSILDASNANAGTMRATNTKTSVDAVGSSNIIEQKSVITGTAGAYTVSFNWTAPSKGKGTVNFYAVINAVNGGGTGNQNGDAVSAPYTLALTEAINSSINENNVLTAHNIYPNPCQNTFNIEGLTSTTQVSVFDLMGKEVVSAQTSSSIDVAHLAPGIYVLRINKQAITFVKQ
jgi:hypothetical protein